MKLGGLPGLTLGVVPYLASIVLGGVVGYYFARKKTEHDVGYGRRVEVVERLQRSLVSLTEAFEEALAFVREPGPASEPPLKRISQELDELERYGGEQEIWLDPRTVAALDALISALRDRHRDLARLPRSYADPGFRREYQRVGEDLEVWLQNGLPAARERLTASFRAMLGVGRRGLLP
jgi:hypothetical protein